MSYPNATGVYRAEVCQRHEIHRTTAYSDLAVVKTLLLMLGSANRDFHRWRTNEMLIATYMMVEMRFLTGGIVWYHAVFTLGLSSVDRF